MQNQIVHRILALLNHADLLSDVTEEQKREASADLSLVSALARLLSSPTGLRRCVFYDAECLYTADDLIRLVNKFVEATEGEWMPQNTHADWDGFQAHLAFAFHGQQISWTFQQQSDWVDCELYERIEEFTKQHLSGAFVNIPTRDQCACHLYLPKNIATEVAVLALLDEESELDHTLLVSVFAQMQRLGLLADVPFARQVCCWNLISSLEEWFPGHATRRYLWAGNSLLTSSTCGHYYYKELVRDLAQLTAGEWDPQQLRCANAGERIGMSITFDFRNEHFTWQLPAPGERMSMAETFSAHLTRFAKDFLTGDFVELRLERGESAYLYLPGASR
jgi:hypothetical protein